MTLGKRKGSSFEREYARKFSLWLTEGKRNDTVWRTSNSGGMATVNKSETQCGDLQSVRPESKDFFYRFSVELKNYKAFDLFSIVNKNFLLVDWWNQCKSDAIRANKIPLLIFRINRKGDWVVLQEEHINIRFNRDIIVRHDSLNSTDNSVIIIPENNFFSHNYNDILVMRDYKE